jgi:RNA polymerase sigma factor (sigma-70 family)
MEQPANQPYDLGMSEVEQLVIAARDGDRTAWNELVREFENLVWRVARSYRLEEADACDVCQTTWLRAATKLDTLREPARFAGWISTIADREALAVLRRNKREMPVEDLQTVAPAMTEDDELDRDLVRYELRERVRQALLKLSAECRNLLSLLTIDPPTPYAEVSKKLAMPIGSIGPTRQRCLDKLRSNLGGSG